MLKAFRIQYTFPVAVELSDDERTEIVKEALTVAEQMDRGEDETFVFAAERQGRTWKVYVDIGRRRIHIMTGEEESQGGLPGATPC